ncbi:MAG: methylated-DNA--[protein]-cysteine S-methyltransferase [Euryarchaeota archaeon]|nr:methylated-DNA--[protein]-cysteine S-methyltransferase [Euryarchaeota archaeon]
MCACRTDTTEDIASLVYQATSQIPEGMVTTYGDIATALGDRVASRAVGEILSKNEHPLIVPCHRVVYSTGEVGWYGGRDKGSERKIELLEQEGVHIVGGKVQDFATRRFRDFCIDPVLKWMRDEQDRMAAQVIEEDTFGKLEYIAGLDVSYEGENAFAAIVLMDWEHMKMVEERTIQCKITFPYIPTFLSYREAPAIRRLIEKRPGAVYLIDGQGVLHPRGAGIASRIGVGLDIPTVGAAKSVLVGSVQDVDADSSPILLDGRIRGWALRQGSKATYVSVGHRVSLDTATRICSRALKHGIPQPLRRAHELANRARREAST